MKTHPPLAPPEFPAAWNHYLASALRVLRQQRGLDFADADMESAPDELLRLTPDKLLRIDLEIRSSLIRYRLSERTKSRADGTAAAAPVKQYDGIEIGSLANRPEHAQACLFVAACDHSGYVREFALRQFALRPCRLAMAAALIRSSDWVAPVRGAAEALLRRCIEHEPLELFDLLELALPLRERERFAGPWQKLIEPVLLAPQHADRLWRATTATDAQVREWALTAAVATGIRSAAQACVAALDDPHPRIARAALAQAETLLAPDELHRQLRSARQRPVPPLRRDALRLAARMQAPYARELLIDALFDRSASPRRIAAYLLRERYGEDPARIWRDALDAGDAPQAGIALLGLSECAQAHDSARLRPWLQHARAHLRLCALRGLIRAESPQLPEALAQALHDRDRKVVREALAAYARGCAALPPAELERAWDRHLDDRPQLLSASRLLDKWQALDFLLRALMQPHPPGIGKALIAELEEWANRSRYRFGSIANADRQDLLDRLQRAAAYLPNPLQQDLASQIPR